MITVKQLAKRFSVENPKKLTAQEKADPRLKGRFFYSVEDVSFHCNKGQVLGLLGPNGAGKTTTLRVLSSALKADKGEINIDGNDVSTSPNVARKSLGFLSGNTGLYGRLTGRENISYFARLHGMSAAETDKRLAELSDMLDMDAWLDRRSEHYSSGMKQKTAIARAVVHSPSVVVLDEPTTGLDIMATQTVMDFIRHLKAQNTPVIFSTHHLNEVEELCDEVSVINLGRTQFMDDIDAFKAKGESMNQAFLNILQGEG
ncbi:ATP-binding cassette domain-containing protein [Planctobacterium marinum]|uniref:ABC transporter n=1 Tax=Planctobacterium marinum TaxID=1631968 RepID=A0AA48KQ74_9ALTE|nr:ABC transporter [Planctobacterium marinum]